MWRIDGEHNSKNGPDSLCTVVQISVRLGLVGYWVAMSSPRGTEIRNWRLMAVIRALLLFGCCGARSQLENAHIIISQLVRSGEIRVRDGFCAELVHGQAL